MSVQVNPDLLRERAAASFDVEEFAEWWAGDKKKLDDQRSLQNIFFDDPAFDDAVHVSYLSYEELYEHSIKVATKFVQKMHDVLTQNKAFEGQNEISALQIFRHCLSGPIGVALLPQNNPLRLHYSMFLPAILGQGTEEQRKVWLKKGWGREILGTYAQTELGHGTNVRGLETRADYDVERKEFTLSTPIVTAYKWWPGNMGHTSNFVVLMAQLYVKGKNYGIQPFLVQIRDLETHMPMPGVDVGDIGPKLAMNGVNNGFLGLKNVTIPLNQMLMKNATLSPDGTFKRHGDRTLAYGTMVFVRVLIVRDASFSIAQAATIATRYAAVRRQSPIDPNEPEPQIMDHVTQQMKLFPQIAKAIFFKLAADYLWDLYQEVNIDMEAGRHDGLPELHALSCCLKAVCSVDAMNAVEVLRMSCGGHGYLSSSNFPTIYGNATPACTYEGETTVVLLQTARFLMKSWANLLDKKPLPRTVAYLINSNEPVEWSRSLFAPVRVLQYTAMNKIRQTYNLLEEKKRLGYSQEKAANLCGIRLIQAATLHARAFLAASAYEKIRTQTRKVSPQLAKILWILLELFLLDMIQTHFADILNSIQINAEQVENIQARIETLLAWIRPNAVTIVDGFDLHDRVLNSTLGSYDGRAYERLFEEAKKSPLNRIPVNGVYGKYLAPFMKGKL